MVDLEKRLRVLGAGDHQRGCVGRTCSCTCGYDDDVWAILPEAADALSAKDAEIATLRAIVAKLTTAHEGDDLGTKLLAMHSHRGDGIPTQYINPNGEAAWAEILRLRAEVERMQHLLDGRDAFIVRKGLWDVFVDGLPARAALGGTDGE